MPWLDARLARLRPYRVALLAVFDGLAWLSALAVFSVIRLDDTGRAIEWPDVVLLAVVAASLQFALGGVVRLHHGRAGLGTLDELAMLGIVTTIVGALVSLVNVVAMNSPVPRSVPLAATFMALAVAAWCRGTLRRLRGRGQRRRSDDVSRPVLILGAGDGGHELVQSMLRDPGRVWRPVGMLDDDDLLRHRRFHGVPVLGTLHDLERVAEQTGCRHVIIAIPSATRELIKTIGRRAADAALDLRLCRESVICPTAGLALPTCVIST